MEGLSLVGTVVLGSNNSFIYIRTLDLDVNLESAEVSISGIYVVSYFGFTFNVNLSSFDNTILTKIYSLNTYNTLRTMLEAFV